MSEEYKNNHYVPIWYQKKFVLDPATDTELHYLDLKPPVYFDSKGNAHSGRAVHQWGFKKCFSEDDLYTTNFAGIESREIERSFFGSIDTKGKLAVEWCENFSYPWDGSSGIDDLLVYLSTQKLRTPKGLSWLRERTEILGGTNKNHALGLLTQSRQLYGAVWMESVWQIADASKSNTKFIVSDHPVTVYNRQCGPRSLHCRGHNDPDVRMHASHTFFPLSISGSGTLNYDGGSCAYTISGSVPNKTINITASKNEFYRRLVIITSQISPTINAAWVENP